VNTGRGNRALRLADRTVAVALLMLAALLRRRRRRPEPPARIGIMKSAGIGDMILASAVARDVAAAHPDAEVVLFCGPDNATLARMLDGMQVVELPMTRPWRAISRLRAEHLDALIDLGQWTRLEALCCALSGAGWTAGFETPGQRRHWAYDQSVHHSDSVHELENMRRVAGALGVRGELDPEFRGPGTTDSPFAGAYVVFHLWPGGYRSELREWPLENWRRLAADVTASGTAVVLTGGPGDAGRSQEFASSLNGNGPGAIADTAGELGLTAVIDVLAGAACVVSVNTGIMHLAAAAGAHTIALNGPTSEVRWGAVGPNVRNVNSELPECGFLNLGFEYDGRREDCMCGVPYDAVRDAVLEAIG
jgi:ADP-heptose:LPS heptosyltransferase